MAKIEAQNLDDAKDIHTTGRDELLCDLESLVNNHESSDLVFRCTDGIPIYACRWLLVNRCATFKSMLSNGMVETTKTEIPLVKFPSPVMLSVVEYLYTGSIKSYPLNDWKRGFEVIGAAKYFMISSLEIMATDFLRRKASSADLTQQPVAIEMLSIGVEFEETWAGKKVLLRKLVDHIGEDWFKGDCSHKLSRKAVEYILRNSERGPRQEENRASLEEYCAFRNVVLWHVYQVVPVGDLTARTAIGNLLPDRSSPSLWNEMVDMPDIDLYFSDTSMFEDSCDSTAVLNSMVGTDIYKDSLEQMLRHINLSRIPASLLLRVIGPLKIIPLQELWRALLRAALCRRVHYVPSRSDWRHGRSCTPEKRGQIYCSSDDEYYATSEIAVAAFIPQARSSDISEWSFEILADATSSIDVGIICQLAGQDFEDEIFETCLQNLPSARVLRMSRDIEETAVSRREPESDSPSWEHFNTKVKVGSVVNFILNTLEKSCRVQFNSFEAVWEHLPDGDYYIAAGFKDCMYAGVELRLLSGFDYY